MARRNVPVGSELSRKPSPYTTMDLGDPKPPVVPPTAPEVPPTPVEGEMAADADDGITENSLDKLANLFNSSRKIQVAGSIPRELYLAICRLPGGVPKFFRDAIDTELSTFEVMLGAREIAKLRKAGNTNTTPKIEPRQYDKLMGIVREAEAAGVGMVSPAKVVAGIFYCHARAHKLL